MCGKGVNGYSAAFNTAAFQDYLNRGGDPDATFKVFFKLNLFAINLVSRSIFLFPLAFIMVFIQLHPVVLLIVLPISYWLNPPQPLIYYAIVANNIEAVRLISTKVDLTRRSCFQTLRCCKEAQAPVTPFQIIDIPGAIDPVCCRFCWSEELRELLLPPGVDSLLSVQEKV